jgi:hypothetical protein
MNVARVTVRAMTQGLMVGRLRVTGRLTMKGPGDAGADEAAAVAKGDLTVRENETVRSRVR